MERGCRAALASSDECCGNHEAVGVARRIFWAAGVWTGREAGQEAGHRMMGRVMKVTIYPISRTKGSPMPKNTERPIPSACLL